MHEAFYIKYAVKIKVLYVKAVLSLWLAVET